MLFIAICNHLRSTSPVESGISLISLRDSLVFPIQDNECKQEFSYLSSGDRSASWFIGDRDHLFDSFLGLVPLLAFEADDIKKMDPMIQGLGYDWRKLPRRAKSKQEQKGRILLYTAYLRLLRSKAIFIIR